MYNKFKSRMEPFVAARGGGAPYVRPAGRAANTGVSYGFRPVNPPKPSNWQWPLSGAALLSPFYGMKVLMPDPFSRNPADDLNWFKVPVQPPPGYVLNQDCGVGLPSYCFSGTITNCGAVSNADPCTPFVAGATAHEWGYPAPGFFPWLLNAKWVPGPGYDGVSGPIPAHTVGVTRYTRTVPIEEVAPAPKADRAPDPSVDADGRPLVGSYRIWSREYVFPGTEVDPLPEPGVRPRVRPRPRRRPRPRYRLRPRERVRERVAERPHPRARPAPRPALHYQTPGPERKIRRVPKGMMAALALFHGATELIDFVHAVFDGIWDNWYPMWRRTSGLDPRKPTSWTDQAAFIASHWGRVFTDPATMADVMRNLVLNEVSDRVMGRLYGAGWNQGVRSFRSSYAEGAYIDPGYGPGLADTGLPWSS